MLVMNTIDFRPNVCIVFPKTGLLFALTIIIQPVFCRSGRPGLRPVQVRDGLPQHRVPRVRGRSGALPGHRRGVGHPGPPQAEAHVSPAVLRRAAGASLQAGPVVPRLRPSSPGTIPPGHLGPFVVRQLLLRHLRLL